MNEEQVAEFLHSLDAFVIGFRWTDPRTQKQYDVVPVQEVERRQNESGFQAAMANTLSHFSEALSGAVRQAFSQAEQNVREALEARNQKKKDETS